MDLYVRALDTERIFFKEVNMYELFKLQICVIL